MAGAGLALVVVGCVGAVVILIRQIRQIRQNRRMDGFRQHDDQLSRLSGAQRRALRRTVVRGGTVEQAQEGSAHAVARQLAAQRQTLLGPLTVITTSAGLLMGLPLDGSAFGRVIHVLLGVSVATNVVAAWVCLRQSRAGDRYLNMHLGTTPTA